MGYSPGEQVHDIFWDKVEQLPGIYMIQREIARAVNGELFFTYEDESKKKEYFEAVYYPDFIYYYEIWENFHFFGLPHGKGWIHEQKWLLGFLKLFENAYNMTQNFIELRELKT